MSSSDQASDSNQQPFGLGGSSSHAMSVPLIPSGPADLGPPSKTPPPNTVTVHYNPEEAMSDSALASIDIDALALHELTEATWNRDIHKLIDLSLGHTLARGVPFRLHCKTAQSLWDLRLSPSATPFRDVPAQRRIAEIVLQNRLKKENISEREFQAKRGLVGCHIPNLTASLVGRERPGQKMRVQEPQWTLVSLVAEFKVTQVAYRGTKPVIIQNQMDYPEWLSAMMDEDDIASHRSWSTNAGGDDEEVVVRLDGIEKWRACLSKAVLYMVSMEQYCGGYLGLAVVGPRFARLVLASVDGHLVVFLEAKNPPEDSVVTMFNFLANDDNAQQLPWNVLIPGTDPPDWNLATLRVKLDYAELSFQVLAHHEPTMPLNRLCPATLISPLLRDRVDKIRPHIVASLQEPGLDGAPVADRSGSRTVKRKVMSATTGVTDEAPDGGSGGVDRTGTEVSTPSKRKRTKVHSWRDTVEPGAPPPLITPDMSVEADQGTLEPRDATLPLLLEEYLNPAFEDDMGGLETLDGAIEPTADELMQLVHELAITAVVISSGEMDDFVEDLRRGLTRA